MNVCAVQDGVQDGCHSYVASLIISSHSHSTDFHIFFTGKFVQNNLGDHRIEKLPTLPKMHFYATCHITM